jgi:hypothetical protein
MTNTKERKSLEDWMKIMEEMDENDAVRWDDTKDINDGPSVEQVNFRLRQEAFELFSVES